jgi:hypothetical protein
LTEININYVCLDTFHYHNSLSECESNCPGECYEIGECTETIFTGSSCYDKSGEPCSCNELDCAGVCGGGSVINECGDCALQSDGCECGVLRDCLGVCGGDATVDPCGECGGNGESCVTYPNELIRQWSVISETEYSNTDYNANTLQDHHCNLY